MDFAYIIKKNPEVYGEQCLNEIDKAKLLGMKYMIDQLDVFLANHLYDEGIDTLPVLSKIYAEVATDVITKAKAWLKRDCDEFQVAMIESYPDEEEDEQENKD